METLDPTPLGNILPLLCWGAFEGTFPLSDGRLGPANQGQQTSQHSALSQALGYLLWLKAMRLGWERRVWIRGWRGGGGVGEGASCGRGSCNYV